MSSDTPSEETAVAGIHVQQARDVTLQAGGDIVAGNKTTIRNYYGPQPKDITKAPYKFLSYYDIGDRDIFFGRDAVIEELAGEIPRHKVLIINGQSGSGKTSLINAGLIPRLAESGYLYVYFRDYTNPLKQLREYFLDHPDFALPGAETLSLLQILRTIRSQQESPVVVIFDQFERFLISVASEPRREFLQQLRECLESDLTADELNLVISLRDDFYGKLLLEAEAIIPTFDTASHHHNLQTLNRDEARQAIIQPLKNIPNIGFDGKFVDDVLLPHLMGQATGEAKIEPPHLQIVCNQLYESARDRYRQQLEDGEPIRIGFELYHDLGETEGMLRDYLDDVVRRVTNNDPKQIAIVRSTLKLMIETVGTRKFKSLEAIADSLPDVARGETERIVHTLQDARILEAKHTGTATEYSVSHEFMVGKVQSWYDEREIERLRAVESMERGLVAWKSTNSVLDQQQLKLIERWLPYEKMTEHARQLLGESKRRQNRLRWFRRAAVAAVVVAAILMPVAVVFWRISVDAKHYEAEARQDAEKSTRIANARRLAAQSRAVRTTSPRLSLLLAAEAVELTIRSDNLLVAEAHQNLRDALASVGGEALVGHEKGIGCCAISPNSRWLATGGYDTTTRLWDLAAKEPHRSSILLKGHTLPVLAVAFTPNSSRLATASSDNTIILWDLSDPTSFQTIHVPSVGRDDFISRRYIEEIHITEDAQWLIGVIGGGNMFSPEDSYVFLWDLTVTSLEEPKHVLVTPGPKNHTLVSPDGRRLVTSTGHSKNVNEASYETRLWDLTSDDPAMSSRILTRHERPVTALAFAPDGKRLFIAEQSGLGSKGNVLVRLWQVEDEESEESFIELKGYNYAVTCVSVSANGRWLASGTTGGTTHIWDLADLSKLPRILRGHDDGITAVSIDSKSRRLVTASRDRTARIWDLNEEDPTASSHVLRGHDDVLNAVTISPDGNWIVTVGGMPGWDTKDSTGRLWRLPAVSYSSFRGPQSADPILLVQEAYKTLRVTRDARWALVSVGESNDVFDLSKEPLNQSPRIYDLSFTVREKLIRELREKFGVLRKEYVEGRRKLDEEYPPLTNGFDLITPDGGWIYDRFNGGRLWQRERLEQGENKPLLLNHDAEITIEKVSHDGKWLVTGTNDGSLRLWDLRSEGPIEPTVLSGHSGEIHSLSFGPRGRWLASGSADKTARLWDLNSDRPTESSLVLGKHDEDVSSVAIDPSSGRWLVTGGFDKSVFLWDLTAEDPANAVESLSTDFGVVNTVDISPNGRWIVAFDAGGKAHLWKRGIEGILRFTIELERDEGTVWGVAFSPDSRWLLTGNRDVRLGHTDNMPRIWDLSLDDPTSSPITLRGHKGAVKQVAITPNGRWMITLSEGYGSDYSIRLWRLDVKELIQLAKTTAGRELTPAEKIQFLGSK